MSLLHSYTTCLQVEAIMKGFASIEKDGHAGELGSTGIRIGDAKFQVGPLSS